MPEAGLHPERALQFREGDTWLHRLGVGWKALLATSVGALALALQSLPALGALAVFVIAGYKVGRLGGVALWKDVRWLVFQGSLIAVLTVLVAGAEALAAGLRTAFQLALVFLPGALMVRTTSSEALVDPLRRWLPDRLAFAAGATLRFMPVFARELGELVEMQRLRGARLNARDAWRPGAWRDWLRCVSLPMTVRIVEVARQAAEAAEVRGIGREGEAPERDATTRFAPRTAPIEGGTTP